MMQATRSELRKAIKANGFSRVMVQYDKGIHIYCEYSGNRELAIDSITRIALRFGIVPASINLSAKG